MSGFFRLCEAGSKRRKAISMRPILFSLRRKREQPIRLHFTLSNWVEKYLKALLTYKQLDFPRTHDLGQLLLLLPRGARIDLGVEQQRRLTLYATVTRYPGEYEPVTLEEARRAVAVARNAREQVRNALPAAVFEGLGS
jgi:HEPN domain-containing protein